MFSVVLELNCQELEILFLVQGFEHLNFIHVKIPPNPSDIETFIRQNFIQTSLLSKLFWIVSDFLSFLSFLTKKMFFFSLLMYDLSKEAKYIKRFRGVHLVAENRWYIVFITSGLLWIFVGKMGRGWGRLSQI